MSNQNQGQEIYYLVFFVIAAVILILGFIVNLMQAIFIGAFALTIVLFFLLLLSFLWGVHSGEYFFAKCLFTAFIAIMLITIIAFYVGFVFGSSSFGSATKNAFDITYNTFFQLNSNTGFK